MDVGDVDLKPLRLLGHGTFGRVFLCQSRENPRNDNVVVKRIIVSNPRSQMKMILEEVYIISQLKHPRIVQFIRSYVHAGTVNIVMEFVPNGTIRDIITQHHYSKTMLKKSTLLNYFCDILMGLEYLHIRHVLHRDLKPENLLLDAQNRIKITDFGISHVHSSDETQLEAMGTPYYLAPEILRNENYDFKSDIWSLGCIVYELCMGQSPFQRAGNIIELMCLVRCLTHQKKLNCQLIREKYGNVWAAICEQMLIYERHLRISLPDILCMHAEITIPYYMRYFDYQYESRKICL